MESSRKNLLIRKVQSLLRQAESYKTYKQFSDALKTYWNAMQVLHLLIESQDESDESRMKFIDILVDVSKLVNKIVLYGKYNRQFL